MRPVPIHRRLTLKGSGEALFNRGVPGESGERAKASSQSQASLGVVPPVAFGHTQSRTSGMSSPCSRT